MDTFFSRKFDAEVDNVIISKMAEGILEKV
jgi:hypothetical protein